MKKNYLQILKPWFLAAALVVSLQALMAQPTGWGYTQPFDVQENSGTTLYDYQVQIVFNSQALIGASQMKADGGDIRFGADCPGNSLLAYWLDSSTINTATTTVWVKLDSLEANSTRRIFMFYGNGFANSVSDINIFSLPQSGTDSVNNTQLSGSTDAQRGFRFAPTEDLLVVSFGKYTPSSTTRWVTLFDFNTQAILEQIPVSGAVNEYHYNDLPYPRWLTQNTQYLLEIFQPSGDDSYYFGAAPQMGQHAIYFDMRYCNGCTQNTFPTNSLGGMHYGYVDFLYRTRQHAAVEPTVTATTPFAAAITSNSPICLGDTAIITSTGATFVWNTTSTADTLYETPVQNTIYSVTATDMYQCVSTASTTVTVNALPQPTVTAAQAICTGTSATLVAGGGVSYLWSTTETTDTITVSPGNTANYDVTVTDANGCSATTATTVTVNPLPTPSITGNTTICAGESTTLTGNGGTSYAWSTLQTTDSITVTPAGSTSYEVTATDANGCSASTMVNVTVNILPTATATAVADSFCQGGSTQLIATGGVSYMWTGGETLDTITLLPATTTVYTVTVTDVNGCSSTANVTVTVFDLPAAAINPAAQAICLGESTTLVATGGTGYLWNTNETADTITITPNGTAVYDVTVTDNNGCSATANTTVTVNLLPVPGITAPFAICNGSNAILIATGGTLYSWNNAETTDTITVSPSATTNYEVTITDANGCSATTTTTVTVDSLPVVSAGTDQTICEGDNVTLTATGGSTFAWSTLESTGSIVVNPSDTTAYNVTVTDGNGCSGTASVTVNVNALPVASAGSDPTICAGDTASLTATGGITFAWSTAENTAGIMVSPTDTAAYNVTVTDANGCSSTSSVTVNVNALPAASAGNAQTICEGANATLTATGGTTFAWSTLENTASIIVTPADTATYDVTVTDANGCSNTSSVTVNVNALPIASAGSDPTICAGDTASLTATGGITFAWSTAENTAGIMVSPTDTAAYNVTVTDANGCSSTSSVTVNVNALPAASAGNAQTICEGANATLTATGGTTFAWSTLENTASIIVTPADTATYDVTVTDANGCSNTSSVTVNVNELPAADAGAAQTICAGDTAMLTATGGGTYAWSTGATTAMVEVNPANNNAYVVTVTDANNCSASASVSVTVNALPATPVILQTGGVLSATQATSYQWYLNGNPINNATGQTFSPTTSGSYTVEVTNSNGCSNTSAAFVFTGIGEVTGGNYNFTVYPNPANNVVYVTLTAGNTSALRASLTTISGQVLASRQFSGTTAFNLDELAAGIYFITVSDNVSSSVQKLVVSK